MRFEHASSFQLSLALDALEALEFVRDVPRSLRYAEFITDLRLQPGDPALISAALPVNAALFGRQELPFSSELRHRTSGASLRPIQLATSRRGWAEPKTMEATLTMVIGSASGQSLSRTLKMWSSGDTHRVIKFTAPADIAGSGFLSIENADGSEESMIYLPALGRVRRIAGGQQGDSFFGSDFSYEDITGIEPDDYTHRLLEVRDGPIYVVEATPVAGSDSSYQKLVLEVPEATLLPQRVEYYQGDAIVKVLIVSDVQEHGEYVVAGERRMESMSGGTTTTFTTINQTEVTFDADIPTEVFT